MANQQNNPGSGQKHQNQPQAGKQDTQQQRQADNQRQGDNQKSGGQGQRDSESQKKT